MLKYNEIISKMTDSQKIKLLCSVGDLSSKDFKILGIPRIIVADMKDYGRDLYPHANALSHAWDEVLWQDVAKEKAEDMLSDNVSVAVVPGAKIKFSPYRREISEDPYLASTMSASFIRGAKKSGIKTAASGYYLTKSDADWLDKMPNERVINEFLVDPYIDAINLAGGAVVTDTRVPNDEYSGSCGYIQKKIVGKAEYLVCKSATDENTVSLISKNVICFEASSNALEGALTRYKKIAQRIEKDGASSENQLKQDVEDGIAISPSTVDGAVDNVLSFIFEVSQSSGTAKKATRVDEDTAFCATMKSAVLLKNKNGVLPLSQACKYAVVGDFVSGGESLAERCAEGLMKRGYKCVGTIEGYDRRKSDVINNARDVMQLCNTADRIILFLGFGYENEREIPKTERLGLPANQLLLAEKLARTGKEVIAVISSGHAPDIEFTRAFSSVILAPLEVKHSADAIVRILAGEYNPSGKLAYTLYAGSEKAFAKRAVYRNSYEVKCGPFVGYRYYDTADMNVGYPFGHGLSYSEFSYSAMSVINSGKTVRFVLENVSQIAGTETVQIYIGINDSAVIRPKKVLCGFTKVFLEPGESRTVSVDISLPKVYQNGKNLIESGLYTLYVGSSVSDIRLKQEFSYGGEKLRRDGEALSNYLQTESNILSDKFTLEAEYSLMKKSIKNILFGIGSLALAIAIAVFNSAVAESALFLSIVSAILTVAAVAFFIIETAERNKSYRADRAIVDEKNKEHFAGAEQLSVMDAEKMFEDAFDNDLTVADNSDEVDVGVEEQVGHIDSSFAFSDAIAEFVKFSAERGFKLDAGVANSIFASMATSKLIFLNGMSRDEFNSFMIVLSEYFGTETYVDDAVDEGENLFFNYDNNGDIVKKNALVAMDSSRGDPTSVFFAALNGTSVSGAIRYITPFTKYLQSYKQRAEVVINESGTNFVYNLSTNMWIVINLDSAGGVEDIPASVLRFASVVNVSYTKCQKADHVTTSHGFSRHQLEFMLEKHGVNDEIPEDIYKKVDKLEKYAADHSLYSIGNKLFLAFERFVALQLSCGVDVKAAVDSALAAKILPSLVSSVKGSISNEERTVAETVEMIFGEENVSASKAFLDAVTASRVQNNVDSASEPEVENNAYALVNAEESNAPHLVDSDAQTEMKEADFASDPASEKEEGAEAESVQSPNVGATDTDSQNITE